MASKSNVTGSWLVVEIVAPVAVYATAKTLKLDKTNNWKGTFTDLDKYENGVEISYSVRETGTRRVRL